MAMTAQLRSCLVVLVLASVSAGQTASEVLHHFIGTGSSANVVGGPDWDGDGRPDLLIASPSAGHQSVPSVVEARSGRTGDVLWQQTAIQSGNGFGSAMAVVGDTDGDGLADVAVAAPFHTTVNGSVGKLWMLSGADGSVLFTRLGEVPSAHFGRALIAVGDQDGDGVPDVLLGSPNAADFRGRVDLLSGVDGSAIAVMDGPLPFSSFGATLALLGDRDGDGLTDFAIGAPDEEPEGLPAYTDRGAVYVVSGPELLRSGELVGLQAGAELGRILTPVGDVDGDGRADLAVGRLEIGCRLAVYRIADLELVTEIPLYGETESVAPVGDLGDDGRTDVVLGASTWGHKGPGRAEVRDLMSEQVLHAMTGYELFVAFGRRVEGVGDVNADGIPDWAVAFGLSPEVIVYSGRYRAVLPVGGALAGPSGAPAIELIGAPAAGSPTELVLSHGVGAAPAWLVLGGAAQPVPFQGGSLVPEPTVVIDTHLQADGTAHLLTVPPAVLAGQVLVLQAWVADAGAPADLAASTALSVLID